MLNRQLAYMCRCLTTFINVFYCVNFRVSEKKEERTRRKRRLKEEGSDTEECTDEVDIEEEVGRGDIQEVVLVEENAKVSKPDMEEVSVTE